MNVCTVSGQVQTTERTTDDHLEVGEGDCDLVMVLVGEPIVSWEVSISKLYLYDIAPS